MAVSLYEQMFAENMSTGSVFKNVLLLECAAGDDSKYTLTFLWNGISFSYPIESDVSPYLGEIADVTLKDGYVEGLGLKTSSVKAKVLSVSDTYIELEGIGTLEFTEGFQVYAVYDEPVSQTKESIVLGYDTQEFVLEDGKVCAALTVEKFEADQIRVLLKTTGFEYIFHESVSVSCDGDYIIECGDSEILVNAGEMTSFSQDSLYFADGKISIYPVNEGEISISSITRSGAVPSYEGVLELRTYDEGIVIVNELDLEDYLKRVVPSEMPASYGIEAAKVQAVCARSYAYRQIQNNTSEFGTYSEYGAHVDDSTSFQVYNNSGENELSTEAVLATAGEVIAYNGSVIGTYYFSTSCGVTTDISIWNDNASAAPYLIAKEVSVASALASVGSTVVSVDATTENVTTENDSTETVAADSLLSLDLTDEATFASFIKITDPDALEADYAWYRWNFTISLADLSERINNKLAAKPSLVYVLQDDGSFVKADATSSVNIGEVVSMEVTERGSGGIVSELLITGTSGTVKAYKQGNIRTLLGDSLQSYSTGNGLNNLISGTSQLPSAFFCLEEIYEDGVLIGYTVYGGGNGHGVGMSQNAAKELADAGLSYIQILEYFYDGATVINEDTLS